MANRRLGLRGRQELESMCEGNSAPATDKAAIDGKTAPVNTTTLPKAVASGDDASEGTGAPAGECVPIDGPSRRLEGTVAVNETAVVEPSLPVYDSSPAEDLAPPPDAPASVKRYSDEVYFSFDTYHQLLPHVLSTFKEKDALVRDAVATYTAVPVEEEASGLFSDPIRVLNFFQAIEAANKLPPGDYIELGSHRGFSLRVIHKFMDQARTLYALDTFEGFDQRDIDIESTQYDSSWTAGNFAPTSVERVAQYVGDGTPPGNLKLVKGWFPESFRGLEDRRWRFVHIDFDLYQPIKTAMEMLWETLLPGGIMMVHDYGCYGFPGARKAVDESCERFGVLPIELSDRWSTAIIRKPLRSQLGVF